MAKRGPKPKTKAIEGEELATESNIKDFAKLALSWRRGKMEGRVYVALRTKLISLKGSEKITEEESELLWEMLGRERAKGLISKAHWYLLNEHEASQCEQRCRVKTENTPAMHRLYMGTEMPFWYDGDADKYNIYPTRTLAPEHQLDLVTAKRISSGITVDPAQFPPPKEMIRHIALNPQEFEAWFEVVEEDELAAALEDIEEGKSVVEL